MDELRAAASEVILELVAQVRRLEPRLHNPAHVEAMESMEASINGCTPKWVVCHEKSY